MKETTIRTNIVKALRERGARPIKYHVSPYSEAGIPDLLTCYRGRFVQIETKRPGEKSTELQVLRMNQLLAAGAYGYTATCLQEALGYLRSVDSDIRAAQELSAAAGDALRLLLLGRRPENDQLAALLDAIRNFDSTPDANKLENNT